MIDPEQLPQFVPDAGNEIEILHTTGVDAVIERFIKDQDVVEKSKRAYRSNVKLYFDWVEKKGIDPRLVTRAHVINYKEEMLAEGKSLTTVSAYVSSVRRFYEWAESIKLYPNIARGVKVPKTRSAFRKESLLPEQVTQLLEYFKESGSKRDFAIVNLMVRTGLRTIEVSRILWGDILFKSGKRVLMIHGKGRMEKDAFVLLTEKAYAPIKEYLLDREGLNEKSCVFISESSNGSEGNALDKEYVSKIAKRGLKAIGLDGKQYTAHSLRHTNAVSLLRAGATLEAVQAVLRHASADTTAIYTATAKDEMRILNQTEALLDNMF